MAVYTRCSKSSLPGQACLRQGLSLISQQTFVFSPIALTLHSLAEKMREFSPKFDFDFCQRLIPCLAGNLDLAGVRRNVNSWGFKFGCAIPDCMVTDVHTAAIKSLLTHLCISVALNIIVHPKLTCEHQSPYNPGLHT